MRHHFFHPKMLRFTLLSFIVLHLLFSAVSGATAPYTPTENLLLNCGAPSKSNSLDGRSWDADSLSKFSPSNIHNVSSATTASQQAPDANQVPYTTARIITAGLTYSFPLSPGPKFVRLYFYPATYSGHNQTQSFFSVKANDFTVLKNFSAFYTVSALHPQASTFFKEFVINIMDSQTLILTFTPNQNSFAFINGIEIVSMPNNLYREGLDATLVGSTSPYTFDNQTAMENVYRLNAGGQTLSIDQDTGMSRIWSQDDLYLAGNTGLTPYLHYPINYTASTPAYTAPQVVYDSTRTMGNQGLNLRYNLTWDFPVHSGFYYLFRFHFCEIQQEVTAENERIFTIYINSQVAQLEADVIHWSGGRGIPVFKDYVVFIVDPTHGDRIMQNLTVQMHPNTASKPMYLDALLNGLEIFKLNQSDGTLFGANPDPVPVRISDKPTAKQAGKGNSSTLIAAVVGGIVGSVIVISFLGLIVFLVLRKRAKDPKATGTNNAKSSWGPFSFTSKSTNRTSHSSLPSDLCRQFSLAEIKLATSNFNENFKIGAGGFGNVYLGHLEDGLTVAIKRLNPSSKQGAREFQTEIEMLSKLRHIHLVTLIGYCDDSGEMVLVYDYMSRGTLRDHLYKTKNSPIPWKKRLGICIGAAKGLHYLHTSAKHTIIHRDVKTTNILLDDSWVAKVSDFGLSKVGPTDMDHTHVSTVVKGSVGYLDPEYFKRQLLTEKSDVYSFGVVLLEVLCARAPVIMDLSKDQRSLAEWGRRSYKRGTLHEIVDPNISAQIVPECLNKYGEIAISCIKDSGIDRPTMSDVVWTLEFALQLQEAAEKVSSEDNSYRTDWMSPATTHSGITSGTDYETSATGLRSEDFSLITRDKSLTSGTVFSEINNSRGG